MWSNRKTAAPPFGRSCLRRRRRHHLYHHLRRGSSWDDDDYFVDDYYRRKKERRPLPTPLLLAKGSHSSSFGEHKTNWRGKYQHLSLSLSLSLFLSLLFRVCYKPLFLEKKKWTHFETHHHPLIKNKKREEREFFFFLRCVGRVLLRLF